MSDHEFERQVRQKLDDLKLKPTVQSWERIEKELRERRRRRVPVFWIPLLLIGLGAGGYFIWKPVVDRVEERMIVENAEPDTKISGKTTIGGDKREESKLPEPSREIIEEANDGISPEIIKPLKEKQRGADNGYPVTNYIGRDDQITTTNQNNKDIAKKGNDISEKDDGAGGNTEIADAQTIDTSIAGTETKKSSSPTADSAETLPAVTKPKKPQAKTRKWSFGVATFAGVSTINEGKFVNFARPQVEDVALAAPAFTSPAPAAAAPIPERVSKIYPGFSYSAGLTVKRELSKRFSLSAGLNYLQLNTKTEVGYRIDASRIANNSYNLNTQAGLLYLPGNGDEITEYRNRYHFIELPVNAHLRINKSARLPLYWNAGISVAKLLSSNSLHYDSNTDVYYKNDDLLTDFQAALTTGFSITVFNKGRGPLWIGPTARYNISPLLKKDISSRKNFMGLGLDLKWYLK